MKKIGRESVTQLIESLHAKINGIQQIDANLAPFFVLQIESWQRRPGHPQMGFIDAIALIVVVVVVTAIAAIEFTMIGILFDESCNVDHDATAHVRQFHAHPRFVVHVTFVFPV